jgi:hypothetical protein
MGFPPKEARLAGGVAEARPDASHRLPNAKPTAQIREILCGLS